MGVCHLIQYYRRGDFTLHLNAIVVCHFIKKALAMYLFLASDLAQEVWRHFEEIFHIQSSAGILQLKLMEWWMAMAVSPCMKEVLSFIPVCICWEIWKARNKGHFEGQRVSSASIIFNVKEAIVAVFMQSSLLAKRRVQDGPILAKLGIHYLPGIVSQFIITR